jgi:hypothetical protein
MHLLPATSCLAAALLLGPQETGRAPDPDRWLNRLIRRTLEERFHPWERVPHEERDLHASGSDLKGDETAANDLAGSGFLRAIAEIVKDPSSLLEFEPSAHPE